MNKKILITGGSGFIGSWLVADWLRMGHEVTVLTRQPDSLRQRWAGSVTAVSSIDQLTGHFDWLVNLAGAGIADRPWSEARKRELVNSRVTLTRDLVAWAQRSGQRFETVLNGSAIGYYGSEPASRDDKGEALIRTEEDGPGEGFAARLCVDWEAAVEPLGALSGRLVILRTGVVLGPGGMMKRLWLPFRMGLGGRLGSGRQAFSWIHLDDYRRAVHWLFEESVSGPVNMTAPEWVDNAGFTRALARALSRPAVIPAPACVLERVLGEMSELLLKGQVVVPEKLQQHGFEFQLGQLDQALRSVVDHWGEKPVLQR